MRRALAVSGLVLAIAVAAPVAPARADGDPASDVLVQRDLFLPYAPATQPRLSRALTRLLGRVRAKGFPMKVAVIGTPSDLGSYGTLFNGPQAYADLLARELPANPHGSTATPNHLLVVMPGGFGGENLGGDVNRALDPVAIQASAQSDGLARAAILAVARLARSNGVRVSDPPEARIALRATSRRAGRKGISPLIFVAPVALVVLVALLLGRRGRDPGSDEPQPAA